MCTPNDVINEYNKRLIYPQLVVSGTYRTYDTDNLGDYSNNFPDKVMKVSDDFILDESENSGDLKYYRYDILLLYVASEGKNRVELFKRHRSSMMAWVTVLPSIPAIELKIVRLRPFNVWAVRYNNQLKFFLSAFTRWLFTERLALLRIKLNGISLR